ncbi:MAG: hypothetical protein QXH20_06425 [Candidatus Bathyarchaeia archaeon]
MGRTVPSYRQALEAFDRMMNACRVYASAGGMATRTVLSEAMFMCILLSLQKELMEIRESLERLEKQLQKT